MSITPIFSLSPTGGLKKNYKHVPVNNIYKAGLRPTVEKASKKLIP